MNQTGLIKHMHEIPGYTSCIQLHMTHTHFVRQHNGLEYRHDKVKYVSIYLQM